MSTTIAFLGPAGTFTEAAMQHFAADFAAPEGLPVSSPAEALSAVRSGAADYACVAIENSVDGPVTATFDALADGTRVQIYREVDLPVSFSILVRPGTSAQNLRTFSTHPVAYQQVCGWLEQNLPDVEYVPAASNGAAAQAVARGEVDVAAAPARAAEVFGLDSLAENVADVAGATTRFVLVGSAGKPTARTGNDRTSVIFTLPNEPGSLVGALQEFAHRGVDLSRIESRPLRTVFGNYRFHADLIGHIEDQPVAEALRALWLRAEDVVFVGSWPSVVALGEAPRDLARLHEADEWVAQARTGQ
ncbi:prephenate dehydratase [Corynebacterium aurimucosum]|uniref:Prephenate dehydratase n=1 Tax=Corynebacterium aurimucosum (strain ATCC 700975 / DSM 44827 / CIP 107346 / CN-1) TaxID=548476 RepID=C3PK87_CORA7|nr:prephenate dehydratase [Corynebacterium aurimucosum]ACP33988.1 Prephenate dehydratase [Corynebacterium aurimucosum ATCC 700975]QQU94296.1 prephenate dehydratase [Corynebacterium aurimucosum]